MKKVARWLVLIGALSCANANAAVLQVTDGILTGATGVIVNGQSYDVSFRDGTCFDLFSGCNSNSDFLLSVPLSPGAASLALLAQVFIDGVDGQFDSDSRLTNGCTLNPGGCGVLTPFAFTVAGDIQAIVARNVDSNFPFVSDGTESRILSPAFDSGTPFSSNAELSVWAVWSVTPVPEPETYAMLLAGLGLLGFEARCRKKLQRAAA
jgi:hypothetical protein